VIRIHRQLTGARVPRSLLAEVLEDALNQEGPDRAAAVDLLVTDDRGIARFNRRHTGRRGATDVLAFPDGEPEAESGLLHLGDVIISLQTARREAARRGCPMREELALYAVHGLLHLLGYDDHIDSRRAAMRAAEHRALARHGIRPHWDKDPRGERRPRA